MNDGTPTKDHANASHDEGARARWREERTTFQRVYDVISGPTGYLTAKTIGERAECSTDGARAALSQLVEMGIAERRGDRPTEYRRNESYFRWKRVETLARTRSTTDLREEVETLLEEDRSFQERFEAPDPDAVSPALFEGVDHERIHEQWDAITRWRSVREDIELLQRAIHRVARESEGEVDGSASA